MESRNNNNRRTDTCLVFMPYAAASVEWELELLADEKEFSKWTKSGAGTRLRSCDLTANRFLTVVSCACSFPKVFVYSRKQKKNMSRVLIVTSKATVSLCIFSKYCDQSYPVDFLDLLILRFKYLITVYQSSSDFTHDYYVNIITASTSTIK